MTMKTTMQRTQLCSTHDKVIMKDIKLYYTHSDAYRVNKVRIHLQVNTISVTADLTQVEEDISKGKRTFGMPQLSLACKWPYAP